MSRIGPESSCLSFFLGWNPSLSSFKSKFELWINSSESSCLSCFLGWNPSLFSCNSKLLIMIDWNNSPESSCLSFLLGWNPSLSSFHSKLLTMINWNISPESSSLSCLLGWNPSLNLGSNILSFNYYRLSISPGSSHLLACWVGIPVRLSFNGTF